GDALGFLVEPRAAFRTRNTRFAEDLNRDRAIQLEIAGAIHVAHAAAADQGLDLVRTEVCALCEGHNYFAGTRAFSSSVPLNTRMIFEYVALGWIPPIDSVVKKPCPSAGASYGLPPTLAPTHSLAH